MSSKMLTLLIDFTSLNLITNTKRPTKTNPSIICAGKSIPIIDNDDAGGAAPFSNGSRSPDGFTGKMQISTTSLGDNSNLYRRMRPVCQIRPTSDSRGFSEPYQLSTKVSGRL